MKCPVCKTPDLLMTERQSIEIDYCPTCRGVWLDRGELDKLIERADDEPAAPREAPAARHDDRRDDRRDDGWGQRPGARPDEPRYPQGTYRKKKSLFDMFDFD
ncbi:TFIIB-type zinc ribbon-containing protein [Burkholderia alba]|uniref:TFIIB-type zinc ribbon-containing protein n=1 Tax=Burkholderia alba TaxID=2683677 RepID=UPI002B059A2E|nr:zf-TFIIB domain-containing protein [Burkholderia alba]